MHVEHRPGEGLSRGVVLSEVTKAFAGRVILDRAHLHAPPGRVTVVTGSNGAGKTTLLRLMATTVSADSGRVVVNGHDARTDSLAVRESIGLALVNERSLQWRLTGVRNLRVWARIRGIPRSEVDRHVLPSIEAVGLRAEAERRVADLSSGQRHRLVLARALLGDPPVLLIDEPLRGLDDDAIVRVLDVLVQRAEAGAAVVVAAPRLDELETIASSVHRVSPEGQVVGR